MVALNLEVKLVAAYPVVLQPDAVTRQTRFKAQFP
jgi:hypothetical protein